MLCMNTAGFFREIKNSPGYRGQIVHVERLAAHRARYGKLDEPLPDGLQAALCRVGVDRLYSHQARAINVVRGGGHVILCTGTASGKTLAYNIPVLEALLVDGGARALYLFPTKALAQDQLRSLRELAGDELRGGRVGTYDGDTPRGTRARLRREARIVLSNPDMVHLGILPNHTLWADFFANLRFVVIDEAHAYRGVFGSHVGCVLRRLWRVCARYGSTPQIVACSATIANPGEHLRRLTGVDPVVVSDEDNGAPRGGKDFVLWNPPFLDRAKTARASANIEAARLFARLVQAQVRTIAFARARRVAELILLYARRILEEETPPLAARIRAYRAGYRAEERREIERGLRPGGGLLGVAATSALELGIDIGDLDASVLVGFPGTIASLWQQAGRAGRGTRRSLSVLIGLDDPLDQYYMRHPRDLFGRPHEHALIDPSNPYVLEQHLPCAAQELPLSRGSATAQPQPAVPRQSPRRALPGRRRPGLRRQWAAGAAARQQPQRPAGLAHGDDEALFGPGFIPAMIALEEAGELEYRHERWYPRPGAYPAQQVSLRALAGSRVALLNAADGFRTLEEIEATSALNRVHPGAIYLHQGESFLVHELDLQTGHAILEPVRVNYYTQPREISDVRVARTVARQQAGSGLAALGQVRVTQQVVGYRRVQQFREEILSVEDLELPAQTFDTVALWWTVPSAILRLVVGRKLDPAGGLHAVEHAAIGLLPLFAMCDRWDIGGLSTLNHPDVAESWGEPAPTGVVFVYDAYPGGVGIAEKGFDLLVDLWRATHEAVRDCPCEGGCPSCVQSPKCGSNNEPLDKAAGVLILSELLRGT
jgi:DEAD/DEAH box helicase domain-containing protein